MSIITLANLVTLFLDRPDLTSKTIRSYESTLMQLLKGYGQTPIELLTRQIIVDYLNGLNHLSYTTHNRHQATIQALMNYAVEFGYLRVNPISRLKQRKPDAAKGEHRSDEVIRYLSPEQLVLLYQLLKQHSHKPRFFRLQTLCTLLHQSGARIAEVLALDWEQIERSDRKFQVVGKGNKKRWCFYGEESAELLDIYLKHYHHQNHPALFTARQPKTTEVSRLHYRTAYDNWSEIVSSDETLTGARLHDLRHTFATERVGLMGIEELRALMGHENIQTTLRYQKVTSSRSAQVALEALDRIRISQQE